MRDIKLGSLNLLPSKIIYIELNIEHDFTELYVFKLHVSAGLFMTAESFSDFQYDSLS